MCNGVACLLLTGKSFRMAFEIDDFRYLYFWDVSISALIYWHLLCFYYGMRSPHRINQGRWAVDCIQLLPRRGPWTEVTAELRHLVSGLPSFCPFSYRTLVQFLDVAEDVLPDLGHDTRTRRDAARQMVRDILLHPTETAALPTTLLERNEYEQQLLQAYERVWPPAIECRRMARLWYRWVETKGLEYPRGFQGTWERIRELIALTPHIEEANTDRLTALLAPSHPPPDGPRPRPPTFGTSLSSGSSNSVTGPPYQPPGEE